MHGFSFGRRKLRGEEASAAREPAHLLLNDGNSPRLKHREMMHVWSLQRSSSPWIYLSDFAVDSANRISADGSLEIIQECAAVSSVEVFYDFLRYRLSDQTPK